MTSFPVWVVRSIAHPKVIDFITLDRDEAFRDSNEPLFKGDTEVVEMQVLSIDFLKSVQERLDRIQTLTQQAVDEREDVLLALAVVVRDARGERELDTDGDTLALPLLVRVARGEGEPDALAVVVPVVLGLTV